MRVALTQPWESGSNWNASVHTGNWDLVVKRDYFNKIAGGIRDQQKLDAHSELVKIR